MSRLHEVLAVDKELEQQSRKIAEETIITFNKKPDHFLALHKRLRMFDDKRKEEEAGFEESKEMVTTVPAKLEWTCKHIIRHLDALAEKERTNQEARADIVVDGDVVMAGVPATLLLALESKLAIYRAVYNAIPTLAPGVKWALDEHKGENVYSSDEEVSHRTEKTIEHKILVNPTKEHPAQIREWSEQKPVGEYRIIKWSGMVSPARKAELLERVDTLIQAVKKARMRANNAEIVSLKVGEKLFDFINK